MSQRAFRRRRSPSRRAATLAAIVAAVMLIAGCASLPMSGPVSVGIDDLPAQAPVDFVAQDPRPGDSPTQIVQGFLDGVTAGLSDEFAVARKYLTDDQAAVWNPSSAVMIYPTTTPRLELNDTGQVVMTVQVSGTIDSHGVYSETEGTQFTELIFDLEQDHSGEWRISNLADGMVISEVVFNSQFVPFTLFFFSQDRSFFVPDQRYFPSRTLASHALRELSAGPAAWMSPGVASAVPAGVTLSALQIAEGVAHVEASEDILTTTVADRSLLLLQIQKTLTQLAQVREVEISVAGAPLHITPLVGAVTEGPAVTPSLLGRMEDQVFPMTGGVASDPIIPIPEGVRGLTTDFTGEQLWGLKGQREVALITEGEAETFFEAPTPLIYPATDYFGWVWTGATNNTGSLLAVNNQGEVVEIAAPSLAELRVRNIALSQDGSRIALIVEVGERTHIAVAAITRDGSNQPTSIGAIHKIAPALTDSQVVAWVNNLSLAVLGKQADMTPVHLVTIGGRTTVLQSIPFATDIAGNELRDFYVSTREGEVFARSDLGWQLQEAHSTELIFPG